MKGLFNLRSAEDLYEKLKADYDRVIDDPLNSHAAFDFVVTAWHMLEWRCPGEDDGARNELCERHPILRACHHLAIGAKHFKPTNQKLDSVRETHQTGPFGLPWGSWAPGVWARDAWATYLVVQLDGKARTEFGDQIRIEKLANLTMDAWRSEFEELEG